ncbi:MAG: cytochrome c biogenesis protein CcsA, partial [Planctomycetales bacterium]|nr:cytochrome c biogenesis protein CcsA [Planctomycetales bacterium]
VFAADPMQASVTTTREGVGLSPLLQHPAMMIHPPIVFAGYSLWAAPCALAFAALRQTNLNPQWTMLARPWALVAWLTLGVGILLGANWAYEELGWGGYWGWDPVENGSLMPWLTGSALIHALMVWRKRGGMKKTAVSLAIGTFALCNFATFLTRSGIFSSLHAFSESPIGWMFLALMALLVIAGLILGASRRESLVATGAMRSLVARETLIVIATGLLLLLTAVVLMGTLSLPLSMYVFDRQGVVGAPFYNAVLTPIGLSLLAVTAAVPLLRWGAAPTPSQRKMLMASAAAALALTGMAVLLGVRQWQGLAVTALSAMTVITFVVALVQEAMAKFPHRPLLGAMRTLREKRRAYAGYIIHLGFVCLAIGITGSSLATQRREAEMRPGDSLRWANREIRFVKLHQRELDDKFVVEAELEIADEAGVYRLRPARHQYRLQEQWTTEVAIHSDWSGDFYTILQYGDTSGAVSLTLIDNPLMRFVWLGGLITICGATLSLIPVSKTTDVATREEKLRSPIKRPHILDHNQAAQEGSRQPMHSRR